MGFSFTAVDAAEQALFTAGDCNNFSMMVDSGASDHYVDDKLVPWIKSKMINLQEINPAREITTAGMHTLYGTATGDIACKPQAKDGSRYISKFTDHHTRWKAVYPIASKDKALDTLTYFNQDYVIPTGNRIQRLRCDKGGEYIADYYRNYCKETGIQMEFAATNTPQQNGVSERDGRTILDMTRCILIDTGLPKFLWGEICETAVFLINRSPHRAIGGTSPYAKLFGKEPDLSGLRAIGARAFVHKERYGNKLEEKAWEGIMLGYGKDSKSYRIYNPHNRRITESRNVTFIETPHRSLKDAGQDQFSSSNDDEDETDEEYRQDVLAHLPLLDINADGLEAKTKSSLKRLGITMKGYDEPEQKDQAHMMHCPSFVEYAYITETSAQANPDPASISLPNTFKEAKASSHSAQWTAAMNKELASLKANNVYDLIPRTAVPAGYKVIGSRWVFKVKSDYTFKARIVCQGYAQRPGIDCGATFAPVCRIESQRILMAIACHYDWDIIMLDVKTAFLQSPIDAPTYVRQPPGYEKMDAQGTPMVMKLKQAVYGLRTASRVWHLTLDKALQDLGFKATKTDPCMYTLQIEGEYCILTIYVDDMLITSPDKKFLARMKKKLMERFTMSDLGGVSLILGMKITRDRVKKTLSISQTDYTLSILERFGMQDCNPAPRFEQLDRNGQPLVWKLKKSLYGLRQSPSVWNLTIDKDLRGKGYTPTASDPCVYTKGSGNSYVMPTLFVDDIVLTGPSNTVLQETHQDLQRSFAMTDLGPAKDDKTSTATLLSDADKKEYQSLVGSLIFLINCTRYDIAFATMMAARRMSSPTQRDLANAKRILRYLKKQPDQDITYRRDAKFELTLYSDASYAQAPGYKSITGSMAFLNGALVHFNSQTQRILAQSSSEAEVIAVNTTAKQGVYLTNIMGELGWRRQRTFSLLTDNRSALSLVANGAFSSRSKHIAVRYNALREWAKENRFRLDFVSSASMLADIYTKYCTRDTFNSLIKQVQAHC
eukprot:g16511.t1